MGNEEKLLQVLKTLRDKWQGEGCYLLREFDWNFRVKGESRKEIFGDKDVICCEHMPSVERIYKVEKVELKDEVFYIYLKAYLNDEIVVIKFNYNCDKRKPVRIQGYDSDLDQFVFKIVSRIEADRFFSRNHI